LNWDFFIGLASIVLIDLVLAGDNAVVIALAVRNLPEKQRFRGIILGAGAAVLLRVVLTFFAAQLLGIGFVKLAGGILIAWIAVKLFVEGNPDDSGHRECSTVWQAMWTIIVADLVMSTDNVLAVAGASKGNLFLLLFGLGLSIPLVVFTSSLLSRLMDRYPIIIYAGAAILGKVAAEMVLTDPWVAGHIHLSQSTGYAIEAACAVGVIVAGKLWLRLFPPSGPALPDCVPAPADPKD
jgi:YjbE family integral membrane protein